MSVCNESYKRIMISETDIVDVFPRFYRVGNNNSCFVLFQNGKNHVSQNNILHLRNSNFDAYNKLIWNNPEKIIQLRNVSFSKILLS